MRRHSTSTSACLLVALSCSTWASHAAEPAGDDGQYLGGTTSIGSDLAVSDEIDRAAPWDLTRWRDDLAERHGLRLSADYATLYQNADRSLTGADSGMGGVFRLYGRWTLVGRGTPDTGTLVGKVEHRHRLGGDVTPGRMAPQLGYLGVTGLGFTDVGAFLAPLYWEQFFADGHVGMVAGRLDSTDFMDILGLGSQWNAFQNAAVLSNMSIPAPDLGFGFGAGLKLNDRWVIGTTVHDANGKQTEIKWFKHGGELFKQVYASWTPTRAKRFTNALHVTAWHQDARRTQGLEESYGLAFSGNWLIDERWMPFFRWGISDGNAPLARQQLTTGVMINVPDRRDQFGLGIWWQDLSTQGFDDQGGLELFYRWELTPNLALTPSMQLLVDPAVNPGADRIVLFGLRARIVLF